MRSTSEIAKLDAPYPAPPSGSAANAPSATLRKRRTGFRGVEVFFIGYGMLLLMALASMSDTLSEAGSFWLCNVATACMITVCVSVARITPRGMWSASFVYLAIFCLFHFGLTLVTGLDIPIDKWFANYRDRWFFKPFTAEAIVLATLGLLGSWLGVRAGLMKKGHIQTKAPTVDEIEDTSFDDHIGKIFTWVGLNLMILCVVAWFALVISEGGIGLVFGTYGALLETLEDESGITSLIYYGLGLATIFLAAAPPSMPRRIGFWILALWAMIMLPLGLRARVMLPVCTALVVVAMRKPPLAGRKAAYITTGLLLFTLSGIAFVRSYRHMGIAGFEITEVRVSPFDAIAEMGGSLRPVSIVVEWRSDGDNFLYGASYWAPFDRALARVIPGWQLEWPDARDDERLLNMLIKQRVSGLGFSPVAEAYRNFGPIGVPIIMFLIGFILGRIDLLPPTRINMAFAGLAFFPLLYEVRNAFVQLPSQFIVGCAVLLLTILIARTTHFRSRAKRHKMLA